MMPKSKPPERLMAAMPGSERLPPNVKAFLEVLAQRIADSVVRDLREGRVDLKELDRRIEKGSTVAKAKALEGPPRVLDGEEVADLTGLSELEVSRLEQDGWFPPRRQTRSRRTVWVKSEVDEWVTLWQRRVPIPTRLRTRVKKAPDPLRTPDVPGTPLLGAPRRVRPGRRSG